MLIACETRARCQIAVDNVDKVAGDTGLFHALPAWLLFVVLYVSGCETIDWSSIPLLSLFVTSMSTFGTSPSLCLHSATLLMFTSLQCSRCFICPYVSREQRVVLQCSSVRWLQARHWRIHTSCTPAFSSPCRSTSVSQSVHTLSSRPLSTVLQLLWYLLNINYVLLAVRLFIYLRIYTVVPKRYPIFSRLTQTDFNNFSTRNSEKIPR